MTALIIQIAPDRAVITTDTICIDTNGKPVRFTNKATVIPHLHMVVCHVGIRAPIAQWLHELEAWPCGQDVVAINAAAPKRLRRIWRKLEIDRTVNVSRDCAEIFHVGVSGGQVHGFRYSSKANFAPNVIEHGNTCTRPFVAPTDHAPEDPAKAISYYMHQQRDEARRQGLEHGIGGKIQLTEVSLAGIWATVLGEFDNYAESLELVTKHCTETYDRQFERRKWLLPVARWFGFAP